MPCHLVAGALLGLRRDEPRRGVHNLQPRHPHGRIHAHRAAQPQPGVLHAPISSGARHMGGVSKGRHGAARRPDPVVQWDVVGTVGHFRYSEKFPVQWDVVGFGDGEGLAGCRTRLEL